MLGHIISVIWGCWSRYVHYSPDDERRLEPSVAICSTEHRFEVTSLGEAAHGQVSILVASEHYPGLHLRSELAADWDTSCS